MSKVTNLAEAKKQHKGFFTNQIQILSALVSRMKLAYRAGLSYDSKRDLYEALGYKTSLEYDDYTSQYFRQDIAKAIINRPVEATWSGGFNIIESEKEQETELETKFTQLYDKLGLKSKFMRLDKLSSLGMYGALFMGFSDVHSPSDLQNPVRPGTKELLYVKPLGEGSAKVATWEQDTGNERYGLPTGYDVTVKAPGTDVGTTMRVHYTRILHVTGELLESEVDGIPYLECVFNRLTDIEKLSGGSAEMFWRGARPGYAAKADEEHTMDDDMKEDLEEQFNEFEHNLRRILAMEGVDFNSLAQQIADPTGHVDLQIALISAATGIPKRILTGSEVGELASSQDRDTWHEFVTNRREEYAEIQIVVPFVDKMMEYGVLPMVEDYDVEWPDLFSLSEKDKTEIGAKRSTALKDYVAVPDAQNVVPPDSFLREFLGFDEDQVELIMTERENYLKEMEAEEAREEELRAEAMVNLPPNSIPPNNLPPNPNQQVPPNVEENNPPGNTPAEEEAE